jgi:hypothetical protein
LKNLKKGKSYYNKTIFEIRFTIDNLIYQAVRNIRQIACYEILSLYNVLSVVEVRNW